MYVSEDFIFFSPNSVADATHIRAEQDIPCVPGASISCINS